MISAEHATCQSANLRGSDRSFQERVDGASFSSNVVHRNVLLAEVGL